MFPVTNVRQREGHKRTEPDERTRLDKKAGEYARLRVCCDEGGNRERAQDDPRASGLAPRNKVKYRDTLALGLRPYPYYYSPAYPILCPQSITFTSMAAAFLMEHG